MEKERLCSSRYTYIFIDEVQNCNKFEKAVDSLFLQENVDIYVTGSNAYMLSGELATLLSGRYVTIDMLPLSFREYCTVNSGESNRQLFQECLKYGSFPYVAVMEKSEAVIKSYIEGIYNTILIKDVAKREEITDIALLENIVYLEFLTLDEIGAGADYEGIRQKNVLEWLKEPCHTPL